MIVENNLAATFKRAIYIDNTTWVCIEFIFIVNGKSVRHKFFGPTTYKKRKEFNDSLRHLYETITGGNYEDVLYNKNFEKVAQQYCSNINEFSMTDFYIKVLPNKTFKYPNLGFELPFISLQPNLEWGVMEDLRIDAWEENQAEQEEESNKGGVTPTTRKPVARPVVPKNLKAIPGTINKPLGNPNNVTAKGDPDGDIPF